MEQTPPGHLSCFPGLPRKPFSRKSSQHSGNPAYDFGVHLVPEAPRGFAAIDHQGSSFERAASAQELAVALQNHVERLLFRGFLRWFPLSPVHGHEGGAGEQGVCRSGNTSHPEQVRRRKRLQPRDEVKRVPEEQGELPPFPHKTSSRAAILHWASKAAFAPFAVRVLSDELF